MSIDVLLIPWGGWEWCDGSRYKNPCVNENYVLCMMSLYIEIHFQMVHISIGMNRPLYTLLLKCYVGSQVSKCCEQGLGSDPNDAQAHSQDF